MALVIVIAVLALIMIVSAAVLTRRGGGGTIEAERPPAPPAPPLRPQQPAPPRPREEVEDLAPEQVAEVEEALRGVETPPAPVEEAIPLPEEEAPPLPEEVPEVLAPPVKPRFRDRLGKARSLLSGYVGSVLSRSSIDDETWDELEEALIRADVGVGPTTALLDQLRARVKAEGITAPAQLVEALKEDLKKSLATGDRTLRFESGGGPNVWLFVGVNGVGKTTTIGKVGQREAANGRHIVMAAGDTFRAAAGEQLELWARRVEADLV